MCNFMRLAVSMPIYVPMCFNFLNAAGFLEAASRFAFKAQNKPLIA